MKRLFDIFFALIMIVVTSPIMLFVAMGILLTSKGPIIYKAIRIGKNGKPFMLYKFRTMKVDSGEIRVTTLKNDERIYPFGSLLRKSKIDELPQLVNILLNQMSVVGPRPEDVSIAEKIYVGRYRRIYDAKPGLTSPASLFDYTHGEYYKTHEEYEEEFLPLKLDVELYYVDNSKFIYDIKIVFKTAWIILMILMGKKNFDLPKECKVEMRNANGSN